MMRGFFSLVPVLLVAGSARGDELDLARLQMREAAIEQAEVTPPAFDVSRLGPATQAKSKAAGAIAHEAVVHAATEAARGLDTAASRVATPARVGAAGNANAQAAQRSAAQASSAKGANRDHMRNPPHPGGRP